MSERFNEVSFNDINLIRGQLEVKFAPKPINWMQVPGENYFEKLALVPAILGLWTAGYPIADKIGSNTTAFVGGLAGLTYMIVSGDSLLISYRTVKAGIKNMINKMAVKKGVDDFLHAEYHT